MTVNEATKAALEAVDALALAIIENREAGRHPRFDAALRVRARCDQVLRPLS
jgi:hypothetical protein